MKKVPSAMMIVGIVFSAMGAVFACVGVLLTIVGIKTGEDLILFLYIMGGIGLLFLLIGLPLLNIATRKRKKRQQAIETGVRAEGIIKGVERNYNVRINGMHPFRAECELIDPVTGEIYLYSSENVAKNISYLIGSRVTVYYDPDDRSAYYVDIDSAEENYRMNAPEVHDFR